MSEIVSGCNQCRPEVAVKVRGSSAVKLSRQALLNCIKSRALGQNPYSTLSPEIREWKFNRWRNHGLNRALTYTQEKQESPSVIIRRTLTCKVKHAIHWILSNIGGWLLPVGFFWHWLVVVGSCQYRSVPITQFKLLKLLNCTGGCQEKSFTD